MSTLKNITFSLSAVITAFVISSTAVADDVMVMGLNEDVDSEVITSFESAIVIQEDDLDDVRGTFSALSVTDSDTVIFSENKGVVAGNEAVGTVSGENSIANTAFNGAQGIVTVVQNSGNNNVVQVNTIANVEFY